MFYTHTLGDVIIVFRPVFLTSYHYLFYRYFPALWTLFISPSVLSQVTFIHIMVQRHCKITSLSSEISIQYTCVSISSNTYNKPPLCHCLELIHILTYVVMSCVSSHVPWQRPLYFLHATPLLHIWSSGYVSVASSSTPVASALFLTDTVFCPQALMINVETRQCSHQICIRGSFHVGWSWEWYFHTHPQILLSPSVFQKSSFAYDPCHINPIILHPCRLQTLSTFERGQCILLFGRNEVYTDVTTCWFGIFKYLKAQIFDIMSDGTIWWNIRNTHLSLTENPLR